MKKLLILFVLLILCVGAAQAEVVRKGDLICADVEADFPGWREIGHSTYGSGEWEGEMAHHCTVHLLRVADGQLLLRNLHVIMNPIEPGDPVPWEVTDFAPVPLTAEAEARLATTSPGEIVEGYTRELAEDALPGCAEFLLAEGEHLTGLYVCQENLVATVEDGEGRTGLRIARWDGAVYSRITSTAMSDARVYVNTIHSGNDSLELYVPGAQLYAWCDEDTWRLSTVLSYAGEAYSIMADGVHAYESYMTDPLNNDAHFYGTPTFPMVLDGADLGDVPTHLLAAVERLDASGYACVAVEGAGMHDAPDGAVIASCFVRLTGAVLAEESGWVQLQIGSLEQGMTGWFRREELAFGAEVNRLQCSFPSYDNNRWWREKTENPDAAIPGLAALLPEGAKLYSQDIWLVGRMPDGDWLVLVNGDIVCTGPAEAFTDVGPTEHEDYLRPPRDFGDENERDTYVPGEE